jgi:hypothetical protein
VTILYWSVALLALLPAVLTAINLVLFRTPARSPGRHAVSVIVPARNEAGSIGDCVRALLASEAVDLDVIVVDDHSTDGTGAIVLGMAVDDPRVRLHHAPPLPAGWAGKQHACFAGASQARYPVLLFLDADVRLASDAIARAAAYLARSGCPLVSGFPQERTDRLGEALLIPLIHVLLLGYRPIWMMRRSPDPGFAAGCGQLMVADADAYRACGGHEMIRWSWHDGITLPRAFRRRGRKTDIFDASGLASCRMYDGFRETWSGLSKNANEGMATPRALPVWTALLGGGFVAPFILLPVGWLTAPWTPGVLGLTICALLLLLVRLAVAVRFRQKLVSVVLMPAGVVVLLALQWRALFRRGTGAPQAWRGRVRVSG